MTDILPEEPDLHLKPEVIASTAEAVAKLYSEETGVYEAPPSIRIPNTNMEGWRKIARNSPFLESQILGLANVLKTVRDLKKHISSMKLYDITEGLFRGIDFKDEGVKYFLTDIYLRRIIMEGTGIINPQESFRKTQALQIEQELGLKPGLCTLTLEQVTRAAIVGTLSPISRPLEIA